MGLAGLGHFAGGAATGYLKAREDFRRQDEEDRLAAAQAEQDKLKRDLEQANKPVTTEDRVGLKMTNADTGHSFYIPQSAVDQGVAEKYAGLGYAPVGESGQRYQENIVGQGVTTGQYSGPDSGRMEALTAASKYNDPTARSDRMAAVAEAAGKPEMAAAYAARAREPLVRKATEVGLKHAEQQVESSDMALNQARRELESRPELAQRLKGLDAHPIGSAEYQTDVAEFNNKAVEALGPTAAAALLASHTQNRLHTTQAAVAEQEKSYKEAARGGLTGRLKWYDENIKDGRLHEVERDKKTGALTIWSVNKDDPTDRVRMFEKPFTPNEAGASAEMQAVAAIDDYMGRPDAALKILQINATFTAKKQHEDMMKAVYGQRGLAATSTPVGITDDGKLIVQDPKNPGQYTTKSIMVDGKPVTDPAALRMFKKTFSAATSDPIAEAAIGAFKTGQLQYPDLMKILNQREALRGADGGDLVPQRGGPRPGAPRSGTPLQSQYDPNRPAAYAPPVGGHFPAIPVAQAYYGQTGMSQDEQDAETFRGLMQRQR